MRKPPFTDAAHFLRSGGQRGPRRAILREGTYAINLAQFDYRKAPLVVQRFGDIKRLVEQTLDPMVSAYFKNVAQTRTLIHLLQDRSAIQQQSGLEMREKFARYNLELQEVLITAQTAQSPDSAARRSSRACSPCSCPIASAST